MEASSGAGNPGNRGQSTWPGRRGRFGEQGPRDGLMAEWVRLADADAQVGGWAVARRSRSARFVAGCVSARGKAGWRSALAGAAGSGRSAHPAGPSGRSGSGSGGRRTKAGPAAGGPKAAAPAGRSRAPAASLGGRRATPQPPQNAAPPPRAAIAAVTRAAGSAPAQRRSGPRFAHHHPRPGNGHGRRLPTAGIGGR